MAGSLPGPAGAGGAPCAAEAAVGAGVVRRAWGSDADPIAREQTASRRIKQGVRGRDTIVVLP